MKNGEKDSMEDSIPTPQTHQQGTDFNQAVIQIVQQYLKQSAFSDRKLTDTPTDGLQVVNRNYVTQNGSTANRPTSSITGLSYYDTSIGKPVWWSGTTWKDSQGNVV